MGNPLTCASVTVVGSCGEYVEKSEVSPPWQSHSQATDQRRCRTRGMQSRRKPRPSRLAISNARAEAARPQSGVPARSDSRSVTRAVTLRIAAPVGPSCRTRGRRPH